MSAERPEAIDSRFVFRAYAGLTIPAGVLTYLWPNLTAVPHYPQLWFAPARVTAAIITAFGICAAGFGGIADPLDRRRGLLAFAVAHLLGGAMLRDFAIVSTAYGASLSDMRRCGLSGIVALLLGVPGASLVRYDERPGTATVVGGWSADGRLRLPVGSTIDLDGDTVMLRLGEEAFAERIQEYLDIAPALRERVADMDYVDLRFDERLYVRPVAKR